MQAQSSCLLGDSTAFTLAAARLSGKPVMVRGDQSNPVIAVPTGNADLVGRIAELRLALKAEQVKSCELRDILCSMDVAALHFDRDLTLRFFTSSAGVMFGLGSGHIGVTLCDVQPFGIESLLLADVSIVAATGLPREREVKLPRGSRQLCRTMPFRTWDGTVDGTIVLFGPSALGKRPEANSTVTPIASPRRTEVVVATRPSHIAGLTFRQQQVLDLVLAGHASKAIAADLDISQRTVENHRAAIMRRSGARSIPALMRLAMAAVD